VKELVTLRKERHALVHGGLRWVAVEKDYLAYLRESKKEALLIFISRTGVNAELDLSKFGYSIAETLIGESAKSGRIKIHSESATSGVWLLSS
jgi:alpha-glucosidase